MGDFVGEPVLIISLVVFLRYALQPRAAGPVQLWGSATSKISPDLRPLNFIDGEQISHK